MTDIKALAAGQKDYVISLRRHFHMFPELGGEEYRTQEKVMEELKACGLSPRSAAGTGVIAEFTGGRPGKRVAIRADMDALPLQDEIDQPYRSQHAGICHACGHDGHTAMLLGVAKSMKSLQAELAGSVRFLFQPSEEKFPGGAEAMIADGAMDGVDYVLGAHLWQAVPAGKIGVTYGRMMASPDAFTLTIQGRGGHGSMPHQTVDPIFIGAQIVVALKTITGCNMDPMEPAVLSLGMFKSGEAFNVIPDVAVIKGSVRTFQEATRQRIFERIHQICQGICQASGAQYKLDAIFGYPPVINHPAISKVIAQAGEQALGRDGVIEIVPVLGGEDFSFYLGKAPGAFMFVGAGNPEKGIVYPQHHPKFDIDETALPGGVEVLLRATLTLGGGR
ncbi:M20 metallopeptidase family protein [Acetonema longum]|uniref:N-acyl-L-amino acid amidohydrolase n=1 Tax=Acetonema longum DSM 6540 TaxID=1009370 RepID=F7NEG3_9FIRM|nr:amidohydrolase [Acetonema longum]EGO65374.1 N-acyl-L-amino acid amidohydrolase [Acetonema longum DSM 6540]